MALVFYRGLHSRGADDAPAATLYEHSAALDTNSLINGSGSNAALWLETGNHWYPVYEIVPPQDTYIVQCKVKLGAASVDSIPSFSPILGFKDNGQYQVEISLDSSASGANLPKIRVHRGRANSATGGTSVLLDTQTFSSTTVGNPTTDFLDFQIKVKVHASTGYVIVRVNNTTVVNLTGVNTLATGTARINVLSICGGSYSHTMTTSLKDLVVMDTTGAAPFNDFINNFDVIPIDPDGAGATEDWTRNTGSDDYAAVDDHNGSFSNGPYADGDTTYVDTSSATARQLATFTNVAEGRTPLAVSVTPIVRQSTRGYPLALRTVARSSGGTVSTASGVCLPYPTDVSNNASSYGLLAGGWSFLTSKPGGGAWTESDLNAGQLGIEHTASS